MSNLLEVRDLKVDFLLDGRAFRVVDGVGLDIREGESVILAGESGSGKTITSLCFTKILPRGARIADGRITFNGIDLLGLDADALIGIRGKDIAYIFQEPVSYLNPVFSIGDQIAEAVILHQKKTKREAFALAKELLMQVGINDPQRVLFDYPHQLSGGMNQRAFIAMALASNPRLLIADEPTTSLDVTTEAMILDLLMRLKDKNKFSLLFITHNLSIAKRIAERVYIMHKGRIVESGDTKEIFDSPRHAHTKELIRAYEKIGRI